MDVYEILDRMDAVVAKGVRRCLVAGDRIAPPSGALFPGRPRLFLTVDGTSRYLIELGGVATEISLNAGDLLFAGSTSWHGSLEHSRSLNVSLIADPNYLNVIFRSPAPAGDGDVQSENRMLPSMHPIHHVMAALDGLRPNPEERMRHLPKLAECAFGILSDEARRPEINPAGKGRRTFEEISEHLHEFFHDPLDRSSVANKFRIHPNHLSRLFRQYAETGFTEYLTRIRLRRAKLLLSRYDFSVKEAAANSGFNDVNYFGKVFRKRFGLSPGKCRGAARGEDF